jgi:hypothetical protein
MQKLAKLNDVISNSIALNITYNLSIENYRYGTKWVTDFGVDYFSKQLNKIEKLLDKNINYDNKKHIDFLSVLYQDVLNTLGELSKFNHEKLSSLDLLIEEGDAELISPDILPVNEATKLALPNPLNKFDDRGEYIIEIIIGFYDLKLEHQVRQERLNDILKEKRGRNESDLNSIYAKAHLSYIISLHIQMVKGIAYKLSNLLSVVHKLDKFLSNDENLPDEIENLNLDANGLNLKFDLSKTNLGHLYYNLYEIGIIAKDKADVKDKRTNLKNYLNQANLFYLENNSKYKPVTKMTRAMTVQRDINEKDIASEIIFLESLITKLSSRIGDLEEKKKKVKGRF